VGQHPDVVIFDFDGTLVDSDEALLVPLERLGIPRSEVVMGSAVAEECDRLGVSLDEYVDAYDTESVLPFDGVPEMLARIPRWAILSNKHPAAAHRELERLGWEPELVMCADAFDWEHKALEPMLDALGIGADRVALVGDSDGDLQCALAVGCRFVWAGWNVRVRARRPEGEVAATPADVLSLLDFD
jgi:HAD superfamily hydrolase (TIGR01549 family)